jgi:hypothetical protein
MYERDHMATLAGGLARAIEGAAQIAAILGGGGGPDPGMVDIERNHAVGTNEGVRTQRCTISKRSGDTRGRDRSATKRIGKQRLDKFGR